MELFSSIENNYKNLIILSCWNKLSLYLSRTLVFEYCDIWLCVKSTYINANANFLHILIHKISNLDRTFYLEFLNQKSNTLFQCSSFMYKFGQFCNYYQKNVDLANIYLDKSLKPVDFLRCGWMDDQQKNIWCLRILTNQEFWILVFSDKKKNKFIEFAFLSAHFCNFFMIYTVKINVFGQKWPILLFRSDLAFFNTKRYMR